MPRYTHEASPWLRRVLIPFWIIRVVFMLLIAASFGIGIAVIAKDKNDADDDDDTDTNYNNDRTTKISAKTIAVVAIFFVLVLVCLILDIVSIVKFARRNLRPKTFLIFNTIQTTFWAAILVIDIVGSIKHRSALNFLFALIVLGRRSHPSNKHARKISALFLGLFIYAVIIYRRSRRDAARGVYAPATNPAVAAMQQPAPYVSPSPTPSAGNPNRLSARYYSPEPGIIAAQPGPFDAAAMSSTHSLPPQRSPVGSPFSSQGPYVMAPGPGPGLGQGAFMPPPPATAAAAQGHGETIEMGQR
ncbi:hypothetical protein IWX90DRAFT_498817 [Phyllosticta citrichinensis]|uniref:Uncharacterized protein n=1 Tax=Phyllosticta citrichinensis TaxID=1130410 RepID=A0ABR1Y4N9_9PEZI